MFSITFTAISNLPQIRARICMFLWRTLAVLKEGTGGSAWLESHPAIPAVPCDAITKAVSWRW